MSGFSNRSAGDRKIFANIVAGKLALKASKADDVSADGTPATTRINKNQVEVYEFLYSDLEAIFEGVKVERSEQLKSYSYQVMMRIPAGELVIITIPADSKYGDSFAQKLHNIKIGQLLRVQPYDFIAKDGKKQVGVSLVQNGEKIAPYFTKEDPKGRPQPSAEKLDEDEWKAYMILLRKFYRNQVEAYNQKNAPVVKERTIEDVRKEAIDNVLEDDDLPF